MADTRSQWSSRAGFILAASGSAIGLGNIVFFGANAYAFGAGAFYLPYLIALILIGVPVLIAELGLGTITRKSFPESLNAIGGRWGEFIGWFGILNAAFITMYYVTILAWVCGMFIGSFGPLWSEATDVPAFAIEDMANPTGFFFRMISSWPVLALVAFVWMLNVIIVRRGVETIEQVVKVFVPMMWVFMIVLIIRGVTLPHGEDGVYLLFTPDFSIMGNPEVWRGAASQIFFSLTLGFGVMTAYASYLPRKSDQVNNGMIIACLNCGFEFIAGIAIFSILFTFAIVPRASTIAMMFFVVPHGIAAMPWGVIVFGLLFFLLLLMAGLTSSISLVEGIVTAMIDKFGWKRRRTLLIAGAVGLSGSIVFAFPVVIDKGLAGNGTLGLSMLDLIDHWAFGYGLLIVGLIECLLIGWKLPASRLREVLNEYGPVKLPRQFDWLIRYIIPLALFFILVSSALEEIRGGIYGHDMQLDFAVALPVVAFAVWLLGTALLAFWLTIRQPARLETGGDHA